MGILDNFEAYLENTLDADIPSEPYKIACSKCNKLFISSSDQPFICLMCSQ